MTPTFVRRFTHSLNLVERPSAFLAADIFASRPLASYMRRTATNRTPASVDPTEWTRRAPKATSTEKVKSQPAPEDPVYTTRRIRSDPRIAQRRMGGAIDFLILHALIFVMLSMTTPPSGWVADIQWPMLHFINAFMFTDTAMVATAVPETYYRLVMDTEEQGADQEGWLPGCTPVVGGVVPGMR